MRVLSQCPFVLEMVRFCLCLQVELLLKLVSQGCWSAGCLIYAGCTRKSDLVSFVRACIVKVSMCLGNDAFLPMFASRNAAKTCVPAVLECWVSHSCWLHAQIRPCESCARVFCHSVHSVMEMVLFCLCLQVEMLLKFVSRGRWSAGCLIRVGCTRESDV